MKIIFACFSILIILFIITMVVGCQQKTSPETSELIEGITIFKAGVSDKTPPPGGWTLIPSGPYPTELQEILHQGDKIYLGLIFSEKFKNEVSITKLTFFSVDTGTEEEIALLPNTLGPFETGGKYLLGFESPWEVPAKVGKYKIRVYIGDDMVASALFSVS